jgi:hypothetical protein
MNITDIILKKIGVKENSTHVWIRTGYLRNTSPDMLITNRLGTKYKCPQTEHLRTEFYNYLIFGSL